MIRKTLTMFSIIMLWCLSTVAWAEDVPRATTVAAVTTADDVTTEYEAFSDAVTSWVVGSTLTLLQDVEVASTITVSSGNHTLDLNGYGLKMTGTGSVICLNGNNVTLTVKDDEGTGTITGGNTGTQVESFDNRYMGGGICVYDGATLVMEGGNITNNTSNWAGGGIGIYQATAILTGNAKVTGNTATDAGGGIYIYKGGNSDSKLSISGHVEITGNTAGNSGMGAGIHDAENTPIYLSGAPVIKDNNGNHDSGICLEQYLTIDGELTGKPGDIHVYLNKGGYNGTTRGKLSNASEYIDNTSADKFVSDNSSDDEILRIGDELWLWNKVKDASGKQPCMIVYESLGGSAVAGQTVLTGDKASEPSVPTRDGLVFDGWYETEAYSNGQYTGRAWDFSTDVVSTNVTLYAKWLCPVATIIASDGTTTKYETFADALSAWVDGSTLTLLQDVEVASTINVPSGDHTLDLNGHGLKYTANEYMAIMVDGGANLTVKDSDPTTTHYFSVSDGFATNINDESGDNSFKGGYITGGKTHSYNGLYYTEGGAILIKNGNCTMESGTLIGNASNAQAVGIYSGTFTLNGGTISYNNSGVHLRSGSDEYPFPGTSGRTVANFVMNGGEISYNKGNGVASGYWCYGGCNLTLTGGSIIHNGGYGAYAKNTVINGNPVIKDNAGGGLTLYEQMSISGAPVITDNTNYNLKVGKDQAFSVDGEGLEEGALIGVTMPTPGVFTNSENTDNNDLKKFVSDDELYIVRKTAEGQLELAVATVTAEVATPVAAETTAEPGYYDLSGRYLGKERSVLAPGAYVFVVEGESRIVRVK